MLKNSKIIFQIAGLGAVIALALYFARLASGNEMIQEIVASYGYIGIFVAALVSGFNLFVPIPAASFVPLFIESGLSFWPTVFVISIGMTSADMLSFILACAGRDIASESLGQKVFEKFHNLREKYYRSPLLVMFLFAAFAPLPNEMLLVPAAFMGYKARVLIPIVFAGNVIFNILFAKGLLKIFPAL